MAASCTNLNRFRCVARPQFRLKVEACEELPAGPGSDTACRAYNKAKAGWMAVRQRLRTLETEPPPKVRVQGKPDDNLWRRRSQPAFAGSRLRRTRRYLFRDVPAERRSSQASITRLAMPASAIFPQARGSYAFLLPTSPSTFSTPS